MTTRRCLCTTVILTEHTPTTTLLLHPRRPIPSIPPATPRISHDDRCIVTPRHLLPSPPPPPPPPHPRCPLLPVPRICLSQLPILLLALGNVEYAEGVMRSENGSWGRNVRNEASNALDGV
ncbi:hypothetical protein C8J57DRAFT_1522243 [Mycena rebaudengoi]|nr:hypothetical protein C8J57DRAFT_1522243 [Mycena rebaudengoi]